jgi:malate synthase
MAQRTRRSSFTQFMEDTAEISRSQLWQWLQNKVILDNKKILNKIIIIANMEEFEKIGKLVGMKTTKIQTGRTIIGYSSCKRHFIEFFNPPGYKHLKKSLKHQYKTTKKNKTMKTTETRIQELVTD